MKKYEPKQLVAVSHYGHVGYPGEHLEEYCSWLSAAARGERLFTTEKEN